MTVRPVFIWLLDGGYWLDLAMVGVTLAVLATVVAAYVAVRLGRLFRRLMRWIEEDERIRRLRHRQKLLSDYTETHDERNELLRLLKEGPPEKAVQVAKTLKQKTEILQRHHKRLLDPDPD